jgi:hypothetical protein
MSINREMFLAYEAVRESGYYNVFDMRALDLANEMNDLNMDKGQWAFIITNYDKLKETYL